MMKAMVLVLIGLGLNSYAAVPIVSTSTITWELPNLTPNCGQATKFAIFGYTPPLTGEYIFDTTLTIDCEDTVLIFGADKSCNNNISRFNRKSKLKVRLVANQLYQFYVGGYNDSCVMGTSVSLSYELATKSPTATPVSRVPYKIEIQFQRPLKANINQLLLTQQLVGNKLSPVIFRFPYR